MGARGVSFGVAVVLLSLVGALAPGGSAVDPAPAFTVTTIDGVTIGTNASLGEIILLDFSGTVCEPCRLTEVALRDIYATYGTRMILLSVFIGGIYGNNTDQAIMDFRTAEASKDPPRLLPWHLAGAPAGMQIDYSVTSIPHLFVINREGYLVYRWTPPYVDPIGAARRDLSAALESALAGTATPIDFTALSIPALLVVAALLSFFSPCSFPVLPAFMAYYLKLDAEGTVKASTKVAAGRGFVASLGIVAVYGLIALVVFTIGVAAKAIQYISPVMGVILIAAAVLTLLPYQYHWLTRPFIALKKKITARFGGKWEPGMGTKLFAFGAGYGAAGFACVAPPFIGAVLNAGALGAIDQAILGLVLYVVIVIALMIGVTVALHVTGDRALKKIRAWSGAMKYVSAAALLIAGGYLLYLFYLTQTA